ncbi:hypothetical protein A0Z84_08495 [Campylobacter upsaliensis]|nr:hypothetical protein [Campylobacter jejuni]EAJ7574074.1 hypothetical protein [Campylobacter upsaliensis]EAK1468412.1 hypothetical protein [Campylobacter upsaliensis]EDP6841465.1 hypothetical protein [Campylobacter upsaliensis]EDP6902211.1 hypothetical protein [Campylobacter upsaliensis]
MWEKKHENSKIRSFRIPQIIDNFFKDAFIKNQSSCITANDFLLNLIENSQEYKDYLRKKAEQENKNQPSLF